MSQLTVIVAVLALSLLMLLVGFVALGTVRAVVLFSRGVDGAATRREYGGGKLDGPGPVVGLSRRGFLSRTGTHAAAAMAGLIGVWVLGSAPAFGAGQGQCTSCVYGSGGSCDNAYSEVVPGCGGQCPPRQGYQLCSQRCFTC